MHDQGYRILGENAAGRLTCREVGSEDIFDLLGLYTEGILVTPMSSEVEDVDALRKTELIYSESCSLCSFSMTIDDLAAFSRFHRIRSRLHLHTGKCELYS